MRNYIFYIMLFSLVSCHTLKVDPYNEIYAEGSMVAKADYNKIDYSDFIKNLESNYEVNYVNGIAFKSIGINGVDVTLTLEKDRTSGIKNHFTVHFMIQNFSGEKFNFSEQNIEAYYQYRDKYGKLEKYDYKTVEKKLQRAKGWADFGRVLNEAAYGFNQGMASTSETDVIVKDNLGRKLGSAEISTKNRAIENLEMERRHDRIAEISSRESQYIRSTINEYLKINTIHNYDEFLSFIYFNRPKTNRIWVIIEILEEEYVFEWDTSEME